MTSLGIRFVNIILSKCITTKQNDSTHLTIEMQRKYNTHIQTGSTHYCQAISWEQQKQRAFSEKSVIVACSAMFDEESPRASYGDKTCPVGSNQHQ